MATFNSSPNILNNCLKPTEGLQSTAAFFVPSPSPLLTTFAASASAIEDRSYIGIQKNLPNITHHVNSSSSYTFMEVKREPCQVSEVTTSNTLQGSSNQHNTKSTSSSMSALVKIESTSPKMTEMEKVISQMNQNNSVPVGIAVARKRPQETTLHSTAMQPNRDMNYFGIRVADIGGVATSGCGSIYFAGADLISGANTENINTSVNNVNRSSSTFWQYPNTFPIESVISMSPVGLQYSRDASRGQLVLLPATATMDSFQQAAFLWPPYMQQNSAGALQSPPSFIFPSMNPQANAQSQSFAAPLQLLGSNYLTAAAAATSTLCQHSQTNGNRFVSISSDTKRIEQSQKHNVMKIEDWTTEHTVLSKNNLISHHARGEKSKVESELNYLEMQPNANIIGSIPILPHEQSHILLHNTPSPSEFMNMPINPSNFMQSSDTIPGQITQEVVNEMYKNSVGRVSSYPNTPEMQDVNIQTDTPVCSEDEGSSLEVCTVETMSCNVQTSERNKFVSNLASTPCHNNYGGYKALLKESESMQQQLPSNNYSKENTSFAVPETRSFETDFLSNRRSGNKNECFNSDSLIVLPSVDRGESSSFKGSNPAPLIEMSGLELLSNISTGSFVNHNSLKTLCVKEEPCEIAESEPPNEPQNNSDMYATGRNNLNIQYPYHAEESEMNNTIHPSTQNDESSLGGLNLLCALAEQRIQEEVESNNYNNSVNEPSSDIKRRKHKHSKTKSSRKSRYYKKNKKKNTKERKDYLIATGLKSDCDDVHENLRSAFKKVDPNYKKLNKWPNPEDFFKAMESDMRIRLADITRKYRKKKRKLDEISKIKKRKKASSSEYKFANISCKNPNFICFLDKFQSGSSNFPPPTESSKSQHITLHNKNNSECAPETSESYEEPTYIDKAYPSKSNTRITSQSMVLTEKFCYKEKKHTKKQKQVLGVGRIAKGNRPQETEGQQQDTQIKADNKVAMEIDKELVLSNEHLYRKETRVLTDMGGLFYAGILKPLQPPDVYAITLDGERGNKSHIMSREEIFKDTILEVVPKNIENVPTGTRLCAYWSQQYRCLYPGKAIESEISDIGSDFVSVEFDDGDSGRIRLQNIRFLLSDYPIVEYSENPFNALGKHKRPPTMKSTPTDKMSNESVREERRLPFIQESNSDSYTQKIDKKKNQLDNDMSSTNNSSECALKHRKHKKRKKHKKHHRKSSSMSTDNDHKEGEKCLQEEECANFDFHEVNSNQHGEINSESGPSRDTSVAGTEVNTLLKESMKSETIGLDDDDSNVVSEVSDKVKPIEKVDYKSGKGSKIAAFLPERQLWGWLGQAYRKAGLKGRARKQFYKTITRGKETITVGECAVFLSTGRPDRPYIGRIESMWETTSSNKVVRVRWFYHPEETTGCPILKYPGALFYSPHEDENDVQTISHRCEVIEFSVYFAKFGADARQYQSTYDNNDTYYLSGYYNPRLQVLKMQPDIPTEENNTV